MFEAKRVLVTGGTGSLGKVLLRRLLSGRHGVPARIVLMSRDEAKQHELRLELKQNFLQTDEIIFHDFEGMVQFRIGDVRDFHSVAAALRDIDIVVNAAALKQVPTCEYFPDEAVRTNVMGPDNIVRAIRDLRLPVETVVGVSTDKAVKPVNVMGMTKALQERIFARGNLEAPDTRFVIVRYGNVLASRGSVIPLFHSQIRNGGPVTITSTEMTRFLLSLDDAVDVIVNAIANGMPGETLIPIVPTALVVDIARALIGDRGTEMRTTGIRPGEKIHEVLISEEEARRTRHMGNYYAVSSILPELAAAVSEPGIADEYSSSDGLMSLDQITEVLRRHSLLLDQAPNLLAGELLR